MEFFLLTLASPSVSAQTIKVGIVNTYSGPDSQPGDEMDKGISLYVKEHEKDLPPGVKVELIRRDDTGPNPSGAQRLAQELVTRDQVKFLAGVVYTPNAVAIAKVAGEAKIPFVIMNAAGSSITRVSPYVVRVSFTIWQQAYPIGKWAAQHGYKKGYTVVNDFAPGYDGEQGFTKGFTESGGQMAGAVRVPLANPDFVPFPQRVKDAKPDIVFIFIPGGKQATSVMKAWADLGLREAGITVTSTQDLVTDEELPNMGEAPLGIVSAGIYSVAGDRPANKTFLAAWQREYADKAIANYVSVGGWDGMAAIFDVIKQTGGKFDTDQAMAILKNWKNPNSPRGPIMIDAATRDIIQNVYIRKVERVDGKLANIEIDTIPSVKDPWKELNPQ